MVHLGTRITIHIILTNPRAILPCRPPTSLLYHLSQDVHPIPSADPLPFLNPGCSSPKSPSTLLLIIASKTLSSSFSTWLSTDMPLYFPVSCISPFLFHIGTIRLILHSFGILPSCTHTFSSLHHHVHNGPSGSNYSVIVKTQVSPLCSAMLPGYQGLSVLNHDGSPWRASLPGRAVVSSHHGHERSADHTVVRER